MTPVLETFLDWKQCHFMGSQGMFVMPYPEVKYSAQDFHVLYILMKIKYL